MSASDKVVRNNPLLPYWSGVSGRGLHVLQSPNNLRSAILFLRSLSSPTSGRIMVRRCTRCHRYTTGAPSPEVDHQGCNGGSACTLPHHPDPCDWTDQQDRPCQHHHSLQQGPSSQGGGGQVDLMRFAALKQQVE